MNDEQKISVEVAYALPDDQAIIALDVERGTTAIEAAQLSGISQRFDGIDIDNARLGIFGKVVPGSYVMQAGDRVEVYRPLIADPKEVRKARAARAKERRAAAEH